MAQLVFWLCYIFKGGNIMERTIWEKMIVESVTLNEEKVKYINIGYFLAIIMA